jgi:hypothetical protein
LREIDRNIRDRIEALKLALRDGARAGTPRLSRNREPGRDALDLNDLNSAREVESDLGRCLILEKDVSGLIDPAGVGGAVAALSTSRDDGVAKGGPPPTPPPAPPPGRARPRYIFLDLETTGFSSTPLFLAGTVFEKDGTLVCTQLLARDYSEERALIGMLDRLISDFDICITFNGKSFDMPYLRERARYHRYDLESDPDHLDLLHHARRKWGRDLPNCRLATLEWHVLGRRRAGDVPGWEVPCIYHEFVHTDDARRLVGVIRHNLLDVVSMAELLICLAEA